MNKICTSLEQSRKLIELGIDRKSSDMYYWCGSDLIISGYKAQDEELDISAWSLTALFKILPYSSRLERGSSTELYCVTLPDELQSSDWYIEPIDAVFEMVVWLLEINIKTNKYGGLQRKI